jgi:hypothetical protein
MSRSGTIRALGRISALGVGVRMSGPSRPGCTNGGGLRAESCSTSRRVVDLGELLANLSPSTLILTRRWPCPELVRRRSRCPTLSAQTCLRPANTRASNRKLEYVDQA